MAGLYVHFPFCKQKCHYCNFYSLASKKHQPEVISAIIDEISLQKAYLEGEKLQTIYFGGGTPSLISATNIRKIIETAIEVFGITDDPEITLEANPDDISGDWLRQLQETSVNRLSIGTQSFDDTDLDYLNRIHTGKQAFDSIELAQKFGFNNLSLDLIYGIPTLTDQKWADNLRTVIKLDIPHISAYALTVETGTALNHFIRKGKQQPVDEELAAGHFEMLIEMLEDHNYQHYEISNFCMPEMYSKHNTSYWKGKKYLGVGPAAHSYDGRSRQWNIANLRKYMDAIANGLVAMEREGLSIVQRYNEYILTSLRTMWGTDLAKVRIDFGDQTHLYLSKALVGPLKAGMVVAHGHFVKLTRKGKFFADMVAADLFLV